MCKKIQEEYLELLKEMDEELFRHLGDIEDLAAKNFAIMRAEAEKGRVRAKTLGIIGEKLSTLAIMRLSEKSNIHFTFEEFLGEVDKLFSRDEK